ncbi:hypothetical protein CSUI_007860 [Cystoisospora suis]|uniref:Uncharacterized protein n=1 Tax=Cystoisospora suis TaxID=483139 RepID=A0A2C6KC05_9APIC|nr:hypothetical protein CSUI_007860 [Cystoisospora suis]
METLLLKCRTSLYSSTPLLLSPPLEIETKIKREIKERKMDY